MPAVLDEPSDAGERVGPRHAVQVAPVADDIFASFQFPDLAPIDAIRDEVVKGVPTSRVMESARWSLRYLERLQSRRPVRPLLTQLALPVPVTWRHLPRATQRLRSRRRQTEWPCRPRN